MPQFLSRSRLARREAKTIIEKTKRAVEIAIEQNEDMAIKWLQEQIK